MRFSLRTLFVLVTIACIWLGYSFNWIRQRHDYLKAHPGAVRVPDPNEALAIAPAMLWLLGEKGQTRLRAESPGFDAHWNDRKLTPSPESAELRALFPETTIEVTENHTLFYTWLPRRDWDWGKR